MRYKILLIFACTVLADSIFASELGRKMKPTDQMDSQPHKAATNPIAQSNSSASKNQSTSVRDLLTQEFGGQLPQGAIPLDQALSEGKLGEYAADVLALNEVKGGFPLSDSVYISGREFLKSHPFPETSKLPDDSKPKTGIGEKRHFPAATAFLDQDPPKSSK